MGNVHLSQSAHNQDSTQPFPDSAFFEKAFQEYLRIRSVSGQEFGAAQFLKNLGHDLGLETKCLNCTDTSVNIAISLFPLEQQRPNVLLLSHLDVVDAPDSSDWRSPPFAALRSDSELVARGAIDAKGLTFMHLVALYKFKKMSGLQNLPFNVTLLAVCGEETGGFRGAKVLVEQWLHWLKPVAVYGEGGSGILGAISSKPTKPVFGISVAEKVNLWLRLDLKFNSFGHGAAPPSRYVNKDMLKALNKLSQVEGRVEFNQTTKRMFRQLGNLEGGGRGWVLRHLHWPIFRRYVRKQMEKEPVFGSMLQNTAVLTNIFNPPGPPNQISNRATAFLDCRLLPHTRIKKFIRDIKYGLFEPRFKVTIINQCPEADESDPNSPYYRAFSQAIESVYPQSACIPILFPASSDNNYFRQFGIPTYGCTPVILSQAGLESIHGVNESITFHSFWKGISVFEQLLHVLQRQQTQL